ncbi:MAG: serine/threonine protein kinase [Phormidesmis sp.]
MLINNRYQVISPLGEGGFGHAYLAEDIQMPSRRRCVLKQLKPVTTSPDAYQVVQARFQREAAILEKLGEDHKQIPRLYAYFSEDQQFYLVQEWVEGETLEAIVSAQGPLSEAMVKSILVDLLPALDFIHSQGIIHRDIKPDNIMLRSGDQGPQPVLIDFGAVRETMGTVFNSRQQPVSSIVIGTPGYMASEQAAGRPLPSSDLYSLGLTAIFLLTGRTPQTLESDPRSGEILWRQTAGHVSAGLVEVIDQAVRSHPRDRYSSASQMRAALLTLPGAGPTPSQMPQFVARQSAGGLSAVPAITPPAASTFKTVAVAPAAQSDTAGVDLQAAPRSHPNRPTDTVVASPNERPARSPVRSPLIIGLAVAAVAAATVSGGLLLKPADDATVQPVDQPSSSDLTPTDREADETDEAQLPDQTEPSPSSDPSSDEENADRPVPADDLPADVQTAGQQVTLRSSKGGQINLYERPSFAASSSGSIGSGDRVTVLQQATGDDGNSWYLARSASGAEGWVSQAYAGSGSSPAPPAPSSPRPSPAPAQPQSAQPQSARPQSPQLVGGAAGTQVDVYSEPSYAASSPHYGLVGDRITVLNSAQGDDGRTWLQVRFESGAVGWVSSDFVQTP